MTDTISDINLTLEQTEGVELCADLSTTIASVTGQAGTGKTTILRNAHNAVFTQFLVDHHMSADEYNRLVYNDAPLPFSIALAAPTGRAAKRIEEATGIAAMTVHRMLRFSVPADDDDAGLPAHTRMNPMPHDVIFVDEASMLTTELRRDIIAAMKRGAVIRFFGDINQLPPVMSASPFALDLKKFPSVTLTENFRSNDGIIAVADRIIRGRMVVGNDKVTVHRVGVSEGVNAVLKMAATIDFTNDVNQIIAPTNTTRHGCEPINLAIQQRFNPNKEKIKVYHSKDGKVITKAFKRNDKIIWTKNDYAIGLMNGTIGRILDFDAEDGTIFINADGRDYEIPAQAQGHNPTTGLDFTYDPRLRIDLGYAVSTHKAQGSQFDLVTYVVSRSRAATRQNVYTAVTRAKERLHIINVGGALTHALDMVVDLTKEPKT